MWLELGLAVPSLIVTYKSRYIIAKPLKRLPIVKRALPAPPAPDPTTILAEMLGLEIIKKIPIINNSGYRSSLTVKGHTIIYAASLQPYSSRENLKLPGGARGYIKAIEVEGVPFSDKERNIIKAAMYKAWSLQLQKEEIDREHARQEKALLAIEKLLDISPDTKGLKND